MARGAFVGEPGSTIEEGVRGFEAAGFTRQFRVDRRGLVHCFACGRGYGPGEVRLHHILRVEGTSDPDDEVVVAALECPCGGLGTIVFTYGPHADPLEAEAFRGLDDVRDAARTAHAR